MTDEELMIELIRERYETIAKARKLRKQAKELLDGVKHITIPKIAEKFDVPKGRLEYLARKEGLAGKREPKPTIDVSYRRGGNERLYKARAWNG